MPTSAFVDGRSSPVARSQTSNAASIGGEVGDAVLQVQIIFGDTRAHDKIARHGFHCLENHVTRKFDNLRFPVHFCAVPVQDGKRLLGREFHSDILQDAKRGFLELIQLLIGQVLEPIGRTDGFKRWILSVHCCTPSAAARGGVVYFDSPIFSVTLYGSSASLRPSPI